MNRHAQRLLSIRRALDHARRKLADTRPEDYAQDRYYRAVLTTRERKVRQLERLLAEPANEPAGEWRVSTATRECEICRQGIVFDRYAAIEWRDPVEPNPVVWVNTDGTTEPLIAVTFDEQARCSWCNEPTTLRTGVGYWTRTAYEAEGDAEVLVYDDDLDTYGLPIARCRAALGRRRVMDDRIIRVD